MARGNPKIRDWFPPKTSIWGCPCGRTGEYSAICGHRRGHGKRPECAKGKIFPISADARPPHWDSNATQQATPIIEEVPQESLAQSVVGPAEPETPQGTRQAPAIEPVYNDYGEVVNAEEIAALLNDSPQYHDGLGDYVPIGAPPLPPGDWVSEPPPADVDIVETTFNLRVPAYLMLAFEWFRQQGYQCTLGEWLVEMALDHWGNCMDLEIGVFKKGDMDDAPTEPERIPDTGQRTGADVTAQRN